METLKIKMAEFITDADDNDANKEKINGQK